MPKQQKMPSHHGVKQKPIGKFYPNETMRLLFERASCRNFAPKKIPKKVLNYVLSAGTHAPTGGNLQPYSIIKIESKKVNEKLAKMCWQPFIGNAPVNLLFCMDWWRLQRWAEIESAPFNASNSFRHFWISFQDTIICAQNICTAADAMGLGSVYIGTIIEFLPELQKMFHLPKGVMPVVLLCLGYPKTRLLVRRKLGINIVVHDEKYKKLADKTLKMAYNKKYPDLKIETTKKRLKNIERVYKKVHGNRYAQKCLKAIKTQGYINPAQRYFGLHYTADHMADSNDKFIRLNKIFGF